MLQRLIPLSIRAYLGNSYHHWKSQRDHARLLKKLKGDSVECNVCGWLGKCFIDDAWHKGTICPNCRSQVRHRLLAALLHGQAKSSFNFPSDLVINKRVLHFAPERQLCDQIRSKAAIYVSADFARADCDLALDISNMHSVESNSFDILIACDVLEHVPNDSDAFREIRRVLASDGMAILTVPQKDSPAVTDEDPWLEDEQERCRRFGQRDHVRIYGDDFKDRAAKHGFLVQVHDKNSFPEELIHRHVLHPPQVSKHPLATNFRRLYLLKPTGKS